MEEWETFWRVTVTSLAVWRVSRLLMEKEGGRKVGDDGLETADVASNDPGGLRFWVGRATDLACWISVWMSPQTAIWVTCGVAGLFLSWLSVCGVSHIFLRAPDTESSESSPVLRGDKIRARNG